MKAEKRRMKGPWYVYMLRCADESVYTGITNDLDKRLSTHQAGKGARYTRSRLPVELVFKEKAGTIQKAMRREVALKRLPHMKKLDLASGLKPKKRKKKG